MSNKPPARKRKRTVSGRSNTSGMSALSDITSATEEVHDSDERSSQSSRQSSNFGPSGSRSDTINNDQPRNIVYSPVNTSENRRPRQVSWCLSDDDEETLVKQAVSHSNIPYDNSSKDKNNQQFKGMEASARNGGMPHVHSAPVRCQCGKGVSRIPETNCVLHEKQRTETESRKIIEMQQKIIDQLLKKDRTNTQSQRLSFSVSSLGETPTARVVPQRGNVNGISETQRFRRNRAFSGNGMIPYEDAFVYPEGHRRRVHQRRSRSCDFLLNDEENQSLVTPFLPDSNHTASSSGYEDVTELEGIGNINRTVGMNPGGNVNRVDDVNLGGNLNRTDGAVLGDIANRTDGVNQGENIYRTDSVSLGESENKADGRKIKHCRYNFRKLFYILIVFNTLLVLCGFSFLCVAMLKENKEICLDCQTLSNLDTEMPSFLRKNGQCCLQSLQQLCEIFENVTRNAEKPVPTAQPAKDTPMVQYKAHHKETFGSVNRIAWNIEAEWPIQKVFENPGPEMKTVITIPMSGIYYFYSRVHYRKNYDIEETYINFGYSVSLVRGDNDTIIDSVADTCFPTTANMRHTSHLNFVQNFTQNDKLYVRLDNEKYLDTRNTKLGLFLIQT